MNSCFCVIVLVLIKCTNCAEIEPTRISRVFPSYLHISASRTLSLQIENFPISRSGKFICVFELLDQEFHSDATLSIEGVKCLSPPPSELPHIPQGQNNITANLTVRWIQDGVPANTDLASTELPFYACNLYSSCTACVNSPFQCDWCADKNQCSFDPSKNCRNDFIVAGVNQIGPSIRKGPNFCPRIVPSTNPTEIVIPAGTTESVQVNVDSLAPHMIHQTRFSCRFIIEGRVYAANGKLAENKISCEPILFNYTSTLPSTTVKFYVAWDGSKTLDNPDNIRFLIFRCPSAGDNCGLCLVSDAKFDCGWCKGSNECQLKGQCTDSADIWLNRTETCPNPEVIDFIPKSGPVGGWTTITINGVNLGKSSTDIRDGVKVAGVPCEPYEPWYKGSRQIVCVLDGRKVNGVAEGPILIKTQKFQAESFDKFRFVIPKLERIDPEGGFLNGSTIISIFGEGLDTGSQVLISIGGKFCPIIRRNSNLIECEIGGGRKVGKVEFTVSFDQLDISYVPGFTFAEDKENLNATESTTEQSYNSTDINSTYTENPIQTL